MMEKVGISTVYTGFNFGSALQAFSTKYILNKLGYDGCVLNFEKSLINGRKITLKKIMVILLRFIAHPVSGCGALKAYFKSPSNTVDSESKNKFLTFYLEKLKPVSYSKKQMSRSLENNEFVSFVCGSDQIWSGTVLFVDKNYYLRFAPQHMRIALAPSFGSDDIAPYNRKVMSKYISEIPFLSAREEQGCNIIKKYCHKEAQLLIDPTFMLNSSEWRDVFALKRNGEKYILSYFLGKPSEKALLVLDGLTKTTGFKTINIGNLENHENGVGPIEFLNYIYNASFVLTDSFHGVAFSIIFKKDFYAFSRQYSSNIDQSSRLYSLLKNTNLVKRIDCESPSKEPISWDNSDEFINSERNRFIEYLSNSIQRVEQLKKTL